MSDGRGLARWEVRRLMQSGTAVVVFGTGTASCLLAEAAGSPSTEMFFGAFLFSGLFGMCMSADGSEFERREERMASLGYLLSRPVGRMTVFRGRLATLAAGALLVFLPAAARALWAGTPAASWLGDWLMALAGYGGIALAGLGLLTEPRIPARARVVRPTFAMKMGPLGGLAMALWAPILAGAVDTTRVSPAIWWWTRAPVVWPVGLTLFAGVYLIGLARDWERAEVTS